MAKVIEKRLLGFMVEVKEIIDERTEEDGWRGTSYNRGDLIFSQKMPVGFSIPNLAIALNNADPMWALARYQAELSNKTERGEKG